LKTTRHSAESIIYWVEVGLVHRENSFPNTKTPDSGLNTKTPDSRRNTKTLDSGLNTKTLDSGLYRDPASL
jgi:hypothetical protein